MPVRTRRLGLRGRAPVRRTGRPRSGRQSRPTARSRAIRFRRSGSVLLPFPCSSAQARVVSRAGGGFEFACRREGRRTARIGRSLRNACARALTAPRRAKFSNSTLLGPEWDSAWVSAASQRVCPSRSASRGPPADQGRPRVAVARGVGAFRARTEPAREIAVTVRSAGLPATASPPAFLMVLTSRQRPDAIGRGGPMFVVARRRDSYVVSRPVSRG